MPLAAGERSHGVYSGKWDFTSEVDGGVAKLRMGGKICQLGCGKPESVFPDPAAVCKSPHQEKTEARDFFVMEGGILAQI